MAVGHSVRLVIIKVKKNQYRSNLLYKQLMQRWENTADVTASHCGTYVSMENFSEGGCWHFVQQAGGKAFIIIHQKKEEKIKDLCSFPVTLWFHLKKKADSHCTKQSAAVEAPQPVKHFSPILHLFSLMFCDAPQEKCFY